MSTSAPTMPRTPMRRIAAASSIGTSIEWYDFFVFAQMSAIALNTVFFPSASPLTGILLLFATQGVGFVARPLGAIIFGHIGDRLGRKRTLISTLLLMGIATFAMGLLPTFEQTGYLAAILLVVLRVCQGLAAGGEWGGAALIGVENAPPARKALYGSFAQLGSPIGLVLATLVVLGTTATFGSAGVLDWAWRVPFLLSIVLVPIGLVIRSAIDESPEFAAVRDNNQQHSLPIAQLLRHEWLPLLVGTCAFVGIFLTYYLMTTFMLAYAKTTLGLTSAVSLPSNLIAAVVEGVFVIVAAVLSVRLGTRRINVFAAVGLLVWALPSFLLAGTMPPWGLYLAVGVSMIFVGSAYGLLGADVARTFTAATRYTGLSLSYNLAAVIGGGLGPIAATAILERSGGNVFLVGIIPAVAAVVMLAGVLALPALQQRAERPQVAAGEGVGATS
ncbi:MFS transporter [Pseudonocardia ailaonensis]|uniref:MFS transporter n=1 Tax=Pseudonocardia ailaonensis TaxID=367279 RepID=A0ABN2NP14_9PSEU